MIDIQPDIEFIRHIRKESGIDLSQCMQCGACTSVCELAEPSLPFPRKEMIWTAWGLKDKLLADPGIWLCHQCGDCTATCPRGVKPGDVLSVIRKQHYQYYARPRILARIIQYPYYLPLIILLPILITGLIIYITGTLSVPEGDVNYSNFFPHVPLNISFLSFFMFGLIGIILSIRAFWKKLHETRTITERKQPILKSFLDVLIELLLHKKLRQCKAQKHRYYSHLLVFWGFILLLIVTFFAILSTLFFEYPLPFLNPIKIAGNAGGFALVAGCTIMIVKRVSQRKNYKSSYIDWAFLISLFLLGITGFIVELARFENWTFAYLIYFIHLILVWVVILYLPYTKFAHFIYRILALTFNNSFKSGNS
jgi:quinone-modifying oxidoreductase subunit QmoC